MGLSAWKEYGPDRWALRCNPSSGNLHPTEAYVVSRNVPGLDDGLHHYLSRDHALEQRCRIRQDPDSAGAPVDRSFLGALAGSLEIWRARLPLLPARYRPCARRAALCRRRARMDGTGRRRRRTATTLAALMGLDRTDDFSGVEREDAGSPDRDRSASRGGSGAANDTARRLASRGPVNGPGARTCSTPHPLYRWPVIDQVSAATRGTRHRDRASEHAARLSAARARHPKPRPPASFWDGAAPSASTASSR